jgi:hypothetical protein
MGRLYILLEIQAAFLRDSAAAVKPEESGLPGLGGGPGRIYHPIVFTRIFHLIPRQNPENPSDSPATSYVHGIQGYRPVPATALSTAI